MTSTLRFAGDWPPLFVGLAILIASLLVMLIYLRETRSLSGPARYLLPACRGTAVALVLLTLACPVWHQRNVVGSLGRVIFALDVSESMGLTDTVAATPSESRLSRAIGLLVGDDDRPGWIETLRNTHDVEVVTFADQRAQQVWSSSQTSERPSLGALEPNVDRTDLNAVLELTRALASESVVDADSAHASALVLMTDGRDTVGGPAVETARRLGALAVPAHAIGIGSQDEPADIGVLGVRHPESVAADGLLAGDIMLKHFGHVGDQIQVRIESAAQTVWQDTVTIDADGQQAVPFRIEVKPLLAQLLAGVSRRVQRNTVVLDLQVVIAAVAGDTTTQNDQFPFRVAAATRERRLLILDGSSRWEMRYLRNLFDRDPRWLVDTLLFGPGTDAARPVVGDQPGQFPATREGLSRYDAVILGEVPADGLGPAEWFRLAEFVTRGGGLVMIDGRYERISALAETHLRELIPVIHQSSRPAVDVKSLQPTRVGLEHPVMNLADQQRDVETLWSRLPAPNLALDVTAKEDAEVWAEVIGSDRRVYPWLVTRLFGTGRVFYLSSDQTWRWRYKVADRFHARFWNQLVSAAMQPPYAASDDFVAIGTDRIEYAVGDQAAVRIRLQDTAGQPVGDATVDALIRSADQVVATVPLTLDDPARGTYFGLTEQLAGGAYEVGVRASGFDSAALLASTPIWVGNQDSTELLRVSLDTDTLNQVTEASGGVFVHESSAGDLLERLKPLSQGSIVESNFAVWQSWYWFAAIIAVLAAEWMLRKRAGLI